MLQIVIADDAGVLVADMGVTLDADIHALGAADVVVAGVNAVVLSLVGAVDADQPAHHGVEAGHAVGRDRGGGLILLHLASSLGDEVLGRKAGADRRGDANAFHRACEGAAKGDRLGGADFLHAAAGERGIGDKRGGVLRLHRALGAGGASLRVVKMAFFTAYDFHSIYLPNQMTCRMLPLPPRAKVSPRWSVVGT